ncbi:uncharacterized protein LOC117111499 [Anneissia japonica]|uniref:uncharacterized protein LOC117111499 n=1 Tax=Anneissia japonica TaxID=1529436 RepID=UPI00142581E0|nr:uncharacterized protein LOC117111499 [Anneissia japonica]
MQDLLNTTTYKPVKRDPTPAIERKTASKLLELHRSKLLSKSLYHQLLPSASVCPTLFGQPKIHKTEIPLRPIVSSRGWPTYHLARHLATLLNPLIGNTGHHVVNSKHFTDIIRELELEPPDILVSFDVESLFTSVPVDQACILAKHKLEQDSTLQERTSLTPQDIYGLLYHCLSSTTFRWRTEFYKQTQGAAMGSPLSPVIANLFMEEFERIALYTSEHRPKLWLRYVDDTFVIWPHNRELLGEFLCHLNAQHSTIAFTMETESDRSIPFLDVHVTRTTNNLLSHKVYRKPTHTDRYLNQRSFHHPATKQSVCNTLIRRAHSIGDKSSLEKELQHIRSTLALNGYRHYKFNTNPPTTRPVQPEPFKTVALPYIGPTSHQIQRILNSANIRVYHSAPNKLQGILHTHKDKPSHNNRPGVYKIPCECGKVYIGETDRDLNTRLKEHQGHGRRGEYQKSSIILYSYKENHQIHWKDSKLIAPVLNWHSRRTREALEIYKHNTVPQDIGFVMSDI